MPRETYTFDTTAAFESVIAGNLADDSIQLAIQTPGIETGFDERKLIRFDSSTETNAPVLTIDYTPIPEPSAGMLALLALGGVLVRRRR